MNIDPLAEKYWSLTTYQYGGNNPVFFIDVNGEFIYINDTNGKKYRYENGQAQAEKDGKWTNIDSNSDVSDFVKDMVKGLSELENSGKTGKGLVDIFSGKSKDITFEYRDIDNGGNENVKGLIYMDNKQLGFSFIKTHGIESDLRETPLFVAIGHEVAHSLDPAQNSFGYVWYTINNGKKEVSKSEILASHYENMIRAESGLPLRAYYGLTWSTALGGFVPKYETRLIDKENNSVYYGHPSSGEQKPYHGASMIDGLKAEAEDVLKNRFNYHDKN